MTKTRKTAPPATNGKPKARTAPPPPADDGMDWLRRLLADEDAMAYYDDLVRHQSSDISFNEDGFDQYKCAVLLDQAMNALCEKVGLPMRIHHVIDISLSRLGPAVPE
jgi:hypothetical protein